MNFLMTILVSVFRSKRLFCITAAFAFFLFSFSAQDIQAQAVGGYTFTPSSGTFTALSGATAPALANGDTDDGAYVGVPIGFNFTYEGTVYTQVYAVTNGWFRFIPSTSFQFTNNIATHSVRPLVAPFWDDLDMTGGSVTYLTTGTAPNRVFTMQWLNARWNYLAPSASISFQARLFETTNRVQFVYRQEAGAPVAGDASFGTSIGLGGAGTGNGNFLSLNNSGTSPTASSTTETTTIATRPATGQIYTFAPMVTAAGVSVSGRVSAQNGRGISRAIVSITDSNGQVRTATTSSFGYFRFDDITVGETYVFDVHAKGYSFATQVLNVSEDISDLNFTAL